MKPLPSRRDLIARLRHAGFYVEGTGRSQICVSTADGYLFIKPDDGPGTISCESITVEDMARIMAILNPIQADVE